MKKELIAIQNMKCQGCVNSISQMLGLFPEIKDLNIDLETGTVCITTDQPDQRSKYEASLARAGYPPLKS